MDMGCKTMSNRIGVNIATEMEQVRFACHSDGFVSALKESARPSVCSVECLGIGIEDRLG